MPPINDDFANAILITGTSGSTTGSNVGATGETGEPDAGSWGDNSVWWRWVCPGGVTGMVFDTIGSSPDMNGGDGLDTILAVWQADDPSGYDFDFGGRHLTAWGFSDDARDDSGDYLGTLNSRVVMRPPGAPMTPGTTYFIQVQGYNNAEEGDLVLNWHVYVAPPPPPATDRCCPTDSLLIPEYSAPRSPSSYSVLDDIWVGGQNPIYGYSPSTGPYLFSFPALGADYGGSLGGVSSIIRDHGGHYWFLIWSVWAGSQLDPHVTGASSLSLHKINLGEETSTTPQAAIEIIAHQQPVEHYYDSTLGFVSSWDRLYPVGIDWSPFEDCIYALIDVQDSAGVVVPDTTPPNIIHTLLRISFDGTYDVVSTHDSGSSENGGGGVTVAADGAVWYKTSDSSAYYGSYKLWRVPLGSDTPVQMATDYVHNISAPAPTNWGAVLSWRNPNISTNLNTLPLLVDSDNTTAEFICNELKITIAYSEWLSMRPEDYSHLYLMTRNRLYDIDWSDCCGQAGWYVGVIGFGPVSSVTL